MGLRSAIAAIDACDANQSCSALARQPAHASQNAAKPRCSRDEPRASPATIIQSCFASLLAVASALAGLATWAGFQHHVADLAALRPDLHRPAAGSRLLALTYDDGPNDPYTWRMMEVLDRHSVKATFFLLGRFVQQKPEIARALVAAGHAIGIHTWDHPNLIFASAARCAASWSRRPASHPRRHRRDTKLFRPPFGGRRPASLRTVRELGLQPIMWNVTCYDWKAKSADEIVGSRRAPDSRRRCHPAARRPHVRMGVDRSRTVEATDRILSRYQAEGYEFVTIPQMMREQATSNQRLALTSVSSAPLWWFALQNFQTLLPPSRLN